ncbi:MAG: tRNA pseudouridine(38-40) synthase TruA [Endozoicomonas sp. (ex Botrylloides leachii)]|nr:tRNA pseudouridine(38-40) synthase TruA [Endozoicomonas sp. (ex Botrylloides leachii)]
MQRYVASIQYDGSSFHGWQRLNAGLATIQAEIEKALSKVANHPVDVVCAGRTDAGVHGCNQIIHFDTNAERTMRSWIYGANANLPNAISVNWVVPIDNDFHARFSAQCRHYRYIIYNHKIRPSHLSKGVTWTHRPLDEKRMQQAAAYLIGKHNFTSYRSVQCQAKNPVRTIVKLDISRHGYLIVIDIQANAFLHHMVRNIAGVLMAIGCGKREPEWAKAVLDAHDRKKGGVTAAPWGLYFVDVRYPEKFDLPTIALGPYFITPLMSQ